MNKLELDVIGRLGKDVEIKQIGKSTLLELNIAVSESYKKDGEAVKKTTWVRGNFWFAEGRNHENIAKYLKKGVLVSAVGVPSTSSWVKDGEAKSALEVRIFKLLLLSFPDKDESAPKTQTQTQSPPKDDGADLPF